MEFIIRRFLHVWFHSPVPPLIRAPVAIMSLSKTSLCHSEKSVHAFKYSKIKPSIYNRDDPSPVPANKKRHYHNSEILITMVIMLFRDRTRQQRR